MSEPIILEVKQDLDNDGWEDETGTVHYDDKVVTPYGILGNLKIDIKGDSPVIVDAPFVILLKKDFPTPAQIEQHAVTVYENAFGFTVMVFRAANGTVCYQVVNQDVEWSDSRGCPLDYNVAIRTASEYIKEEIDA